MRLYAYIILICVVGLLSHTFGATHVRGYYRKNGTYVAPHERSRPSRSYSSRSSRDYGSSSGGSYLYGGSGTGGVRNDPNYDNIMESLKDCQALNDDGTPCRRRALPGKTYCYLHVGYKPPSPKNRIYCDSELHKMTLKRIDALRSAIRQYKINNRQVPPDSLASISSLTNDAWERPLYYETDGKDYAIVSDGDDGIAETEDDICFLSNEQPQCQAVLSDGTMCKKIAEPKSWYCDRHRAKEKVVRTGEVAQDGMTGSTQGQSKGDGESAAVSKRSKRVDVHVVFDVFVFIFGIMVSAWVLYMAARLRRGRDNYQSVR